MPKVLMIAEGFTGRDPGTLWGHSPGDIISILPDESDFGTCTVPKFWRIIVNGVTVDQLHALTHPQITDNTGVLNIVNGKVERFRRKEWRADITRLPQAIRNTLNSGATYTVTVGNLSTLRNALRRYRDDTAYDGF